MAARDIDLRQRTELRQTISPRLQQSLRLLTLSNLELESAVAAELEANPVLERDDFGDAEPLPDNNTAPDDLETLDWQEYFASAGGDTSEVWGEVADPFARIAFPDVSLSAYLIRQLEVTALEPRVMELALELVTAFDAAGYLRTPLPALADEMGVTVEELEQVLVNVVQKLDPPGVGARDLAECLLLQWRAAGEGAPPLARKIIEENLADIAGKPIAALAARLKADEAEVRGAVAFIRSLEPRPGRSFGGQVNPSVVPDIRVELAGSRARVTVLDDRSGRLFISPSYRELLTADGQDESTRRFLRQRVAAAAWFIRALEQRRRTLENVTRVIFERQKDFLTEGDEGLKPLTMEEVAERVGLHVSTVSRAVAGKVVDTPRGNYRLRDFFTGSLATTSSAGESQVAAGKVKALLNDLVATEDKQQPYSDEELVAALAARGIKVARRTVAKYRNELRIPGSHERKTRV